MAEESPRGLFWANAPSWEKLLFFFAPTVCVTRACGLSETKCLGEVRLYKMIRTLSLSFFFSITHRSLSTLRILQPFFFSATRFTTLTNPSRVGIDQLCRGIKFRGGALFVARLSSDFVNLSPTMDQVHVENDVQNFDILVAKNDDHGGVIIEMKESMDSKVFVPLLRASLSHWRQQGKKGVWIKIPIDLVNLVEYAVKEGFWYHHAEPGYLMLVYWIPEGANTIPVNATHRVGVGAFVMNDNREVLVVQEKSGIFRGSGVWKFPTGVVDEGEDIYAAAVREVKEETGIDSKFVEVLAFRQSHKAFFDKSDLFFVCLLKPLSFDIQKQEQEIEAAQWMRFEEYVAQPFVKKHEVMKYITDVCQAKVDGQYSGFAPLSTSSSFSNQKSFLYVNAKDLDRQ